MVHWWIYFYQFTCIKMSYFPCKMIFSEFPACSWHEQAIHHYCISLSFSFVAKGKEKVIYSLNNVLIQMQPSVHTYFDRDTGSRYISVLQCKLCVPQRSGFKGNPLYSVGKKRKNHIRDLHPEHSAQTCFQKAYPLRFCNCYNSH